MLSLVPGSNPGLSATLSLRAISVGGALLVLALWPLAARAEPGRTPPAIQGLHERGPVVLAVRYQPLEHPVLDTLIAREGLEAIVSGATTEWDRVLRLKDWVAAQFEHGLPDPYPPWNALIILDWIRRGVTGGFCAQYAQVLLQTLAAFGVPARYIEIGSAENPTSHYLLEAWSNDHVKWVVLDPDFNLHFERDGVPQSALEVHRALLAGEVDRLVVVRGRVQAGHPDPDEYPLRTVELYALLRFHLKADHLTEPEPAFDRQRDVVEWQDPGTPPRDPWPLAGGAVSRDAEAYPVLNQVRVWLGARAPGQVLVRLGHSMVGFLGYEVWEAGVDAAWRPQPEPGWWWALRPGANRLHIRSRNLRGVTGPATVIEVLEPPATP